MFDIELHNLVLAQSETAQPASGGEALPPIIGESSSAGGGTVSSSGTGSTGNTNTNPSIFEGFLPIILVMFVVMIIFSMMGSRRERKKRAALISSISKHDKVQTVGGVIGSVVEIKSDTIVLKVDEAANTRITFARSAIQQVITSSETVGKAPSQELTTPR